MDYKKLFDLTGKACIVTGAIGYLGSENVKILKDFGATVVAADIRGGETRWENQETYYDMFVKLDIASTESFKACFKAVAKSTVTLMSSLMRLFLVQAMVRKVTLNS